MSYLPLAHIFDRVIEECFIHHGASIGFWRGVRILAMIHYLFRKIIYQSFTKDYLLYSMVIDGSCIVCLGFLHQYMGHNNDFFLVIVIEDIFSVTISFSSLPMKDFLSYLYMTYLFQDVKLLIEDIGELKPTIFCAVPRVLDRVYSGKIFF